MSKTRNERKLARERLLVRSVALGLALAAAIIAWKVG